MSYIEMGNLDIDKDLITCKKCDNYLTLNSCKDFCNKNIIKRDKKTIMLAGTMWLKSQNQRREEEFTTYWREAVGGVLRSKYYIINPVKIGSEVESDYYTKGFYLVKRADIIIFEFRSMNKYSYIGTTFELGISRILGEARNIIWCSDVLPQHPWLKSFSELDTSILSIIKKLGIEKDISLSDKFKEVYGDS